MISSKMCKFPEAPHILSTFMFLLSLVTFTTGDTSMMTVSEGEDIQLDFSYPCNCSKVTLQYGNRAPFYDSVDPESTSLPENQELIERTESDKCFIRLLFTPVSRSDDGGYILTSYDNDQNYLEDTRIGMRVDHPPGMASCEWSEQNIVDDWGSMLCKAPAGSTPGQISCYQNGIRLPPRNAPTEAGNILQQAIWVRYPQSAFCCASLQEEVIDKCACKDFVWDPLHSKGNITDPCAAPLQDSTPPQDPEEDTKTNSDDIITSPPTTFRITKRPAPKKIYISLYWGFSAIIGTLIFIIIIQCVILRAAFRKIRQIMENRQQNGSYENVPTVEVQL